MNKKFKRMLATVSAIVMCSLSAIPFGAFAVESDTLLDRVIKSYGEPSVTCKQGSEVFIIKENEQHLLAYNSVDTYINMKYDKILTDDIFNYLDDDVDVVFSDMGNHLIQYRLISENEEAEMKAVETLSQKYDGILSIDKVSIVWGEPPFSIDGAWVKLNDISEEIISGYEVKDYEYTLGHWNDGTPIISDEHKFVSFNSEAECYEFVKKMQDNNIEYELSACVAEIMPPIIAEETVHLYKSSDYDLYFNDNISINSPEPTLIGDANEDGEVNISDAVLIMQSITNPSEYTLTIQGMANADVADNDGITLLDALRIQEMQVGK